MPVATEQGARTGEPERPGETPERCEDGEPPERHPDHAGGQRDEGPDHGKKPGDEDGGLAAAFEPIVSPVHLGAPEQNVAAPPIHEWPPSRVAHAPGDPRPNNVAGGA